MQLIEGIRNRRAINFFDNTKEISDKEIIDVLELANLSPSSMNLQPWETVVVKSSEKKEVLKKYCFNQAKVTEASANIIVLADPEGLDKNIDDVLNSWVELGYMQQDQIEAYKKNAFGLYKDKYSQKRKDFAIKNASFFAMSIMYAARAYGFETHPMDGFIEEKIKIKFKIPDNMMIPVIISIGYPKDGLTLLPRAFRKKGERLFKIV